MAKQLNICIGQAIRARRNAMNMSAEQLAELIDTTPGFVTIVERGKKGMALSKLLKLCSIFDCSINDLVAGSEHSGPKSHARRLLAYMESLNMQHKEDIDFLIDFIKLEADYRRLKSISADG